jgi:hypothetical protein
MTPRLFEAKIPTGFFPATRAIALLFFMAAVPAMVAQGQNPNPDFRKWTMQEAVGLLTRSPWAKQETYTRIVGGVGSGISGEKEIYSTFFVRFLSARPIREAYARVRQLQANYDSLSPDLRLKLDQSLEPGLKLDVSRWIVVTVGFRSNDPSMELRVRQFLEVQTTESMRPRAYLSTPRTPQLTLAGYFPPKEDEVGGKFVFPRSVAGSAVLSGKDDAVSFELDIPGLEPDLRASFPVSEMIVNGEPVI